MYSTHLLRLLFVCASVSECFCQTWRYPQSESQLHVLEQTITFIVNWKEPTFNNYLFVFSVGFLAMLFATCQTLNWCCTCGKVFFMSDHMQTYLWQLLYYGSSIVNNLNRPFVTLSFHFIAAGHLTKLDDLKVNNLVTELINYGVRPMLSTVSWTVTSTISRQPEVFNLKLTENRNSFCLPSLISNR